MARRDAILRLHKVLINRRAEIHKRLAQTLNPSGDQFDVASRVARLDAEKLPPEAAELVELEARELTQITNALRRLKQGTYGLCEMCQEKIPIARLNALPHVTVCVRCQRDAEIEHRSTSEPVTPSDPDVPAFDHGSFE